MSGYCLSELGRGIDADCQPNTQCLLPSGSVVPLDVVRNDDADNAVHRWITMILRLNVSVRL